MPLLRQNLGEEHWMCIPTDAKNALSTPLQCRWSQVSQKCGMGVQNGNQTLTGWREPPRRSARKFAADRSRTFNIPRTAPVLTPTRTTSETVTVQTIAATISANTGTGPPLRRRLHKQGILVHHLCGRDFRRRHQMASPRLPAAKRRAANTWHCALATRFYCRQLPKKTPDRVTNSSRPSWTLEPRRASRLPSSSQDLWSRQPCPKLAVVTASQTASASQILGSKLSISRPTRGSRLACCSRRRKLKDR